MKLYLQYTTKKEKKLIKQASKFENQSDAKKKGWKKIGNGAFKTAYKKDKIIIKFSNDGIIENHMKNEVKKYFSVPKRDKKYFARIFGGNNKKIIQRHVVIKPYGKFTAKERDKAWKIVKKLKIWDASPGHNVTVVDGQPIIYDFGHYHK